MLAGHAPALTVVVAQTVDSKWLLEIEAIAAECGVPVRVLDPLGGEGIAGRGDYFSLMRYNVGMLEEVLR